MEFISQTESVHDLIHECGEEMDGMVEILKNLKNKHSQYKESETYKMIEKAIIDLTNVTITENGDKAYKSSMNALVDLYYKSLRNVDEDELRTLFKAAYAENAYLTRRMIAYIRDIRGGKGERFIGKVLLEELAKADMNALRNNALKYFDIYGRWDDGVLFNKNQYEGDKRNERNRAYEEQQLRNKLKENLKKKSNNNTFKTLILTEKEDKKGVKEGEVYKKYSEELLDVYVETVVAQLYNDIQSMNDGKSISLCAKWVPSEKGSHGYVYKRIAKSYGLNCGDFRKLVLSPLRRKLNILETKLCNKDYEHIDYEEVPSVAMNKHSKAPSAKGRKYFKNEHNAFMRNDKERFMEYKSKVVKGEAKVNVKALFPHQIVQHYYNPDNHRPSHFMDDLVEGQWKTMVEEMRNIGDLSESLVLADVSGSMSGMPMLISYTMGILISSIAKCEVWKNVVLTFESQPRLVKVSGETLYEKVKSIAQAPWGGSTDFMAALNVILDMAIKYKLNQDDLPKRLIVVSDMQFNIADHSANYGSFEVAKKKFEAAGYTLPQMVFWNVRSTDTVPVMSGISGVSLVSGYSPNVLKSILYNTTVTLEETMMNAIMDTRYDLII